MKIPGEIQPFGKLYLTPSSNGITRPSAVRGSGFKMVNMGELYAHPRLKDPPMERVPLSENERRKFSLEPGDLLFARQSLVLEGAGKCCIVLECEENTCFESHLIRVRLDSHKANSQFYYYFFKSGTGSGTVQTIVNQVAAAGIRGSDLAKLKVLWPPVKVQDKIAAILSAYDELIETNKRLIALLEKLAEEIYREWFVRLRFPDHERVKLVKGVPQGWHVKRISEVVDFLSGYTFKSETYTPAGNFGIVTIKNVQEGYFIPECTDSIEAPPSNMKAHCVLNVGDVLMSLTGNVGRVCHVYGSNLLLNQRVAKLRSKLKNGTQFIYYTFNNRSMIQLIENLSLGSTAQMNLSHIQLGKQKLVVPNSDLLERFEEIVRPLTDQKLNLCCQSAKLEDLRDRLLPRLISGKLPVENLDIQFPPLSMTDQIE